MAASYNNQMSRHTFLKTNTGYCSNKKWEGVQLTLSQEKCKFSCGYLKLTILFHIDVSYNLRSME